MPDTNHDGRACDPTTLVSSAVASCGIASAMTGRMRRPGPELSTKNRCRAVRVEAALAPSASVNPSSSQARPGRPP